MILAAFTCEELPLGINYKMGSYAFYRHLAAENRLPCGMIALEMLGSYSPKKGSQQYPFPLNMYLPNRGDFIAFVSDDTSRDFVCSITEDYRKSSSVASFGATIPMSLVPDVVRSDHGEFVRHGGPGLMVTDTADFRSCCHCNVSGDTVDKLDFRLMTRVVIAMCEVVRSFD